MPKNKLALFACLAAVGCEPSRQAVYVEVGALGGDQADVVRHEPSSATIGSQTFTLHNEIPAARAGSSGLEAAAASDRARAIVSRNRAFALRDLREHLFRAYARKHDPWRKAKMQEISELARQVETELREGLFSRFERYAAERGPLVSRLAFLVGFPFGPPITWASVPSWSPWEASRRAEALAIHAKMLALEQDYLRDTRTLEDQAQDTISAARASFQVEYAVRLDEASQQANKDSEVQFGSTEKALASELSALRLAVPEIAGETVSLQVSPLKAQGARTAASSPAGRGWMIEHDLEIWLAQRGYSLVQSREGARDATTEFLTWRRTHHPGH